MRRPVLSSVVLMVLIAVPGAAAVARQGAPDVTVRLARVPDQKGTPVELDAAGRFRLEGAKSGAWTAIVSAPGDYLEKWVARELKVRNWKLGAAPLKGAQPAAAAEEVDSDKASREFRITAHDARGKAHELTFSLVVSVDNVAGDDRGVGRYDKPMRWHQLKEGLPFKFRVGRGRGGGDVTNVITGQVQRVLTIDTLPPVSAAKPVRPK